MFPAEFSLMYGLRSSSVGVASPPLFFSRAHVVLAPSMVCRFVMQPCACAVDLAFTRLGIATVASRAMMATTIMISINVNPPLGDVLIFILTFLLGCGVNEATGGLSLLQYLFTYCLLLTAGYIVSNRPDKATGNSLI